MPLLFRRKSVRGLENASAGSAGGPAVAEPTRPSSSNTTHLFSRPASSGGLKTRPKSSLAPPPPPVPPLPLQRHHSHQNIRLHPSDATARQRSTSSTRPSSPSRPASENGAVVPPAISSSASFLSPLAHDLQPDELSEADEAGAAAAGPSSSQTKPKRFSLMKLRNFSESHLGSRAKMDPPKRIEEDEQDSRPTPTEPVEDLPQQVPVVIRTAPTSDGAVVSDMGGGTAAFGETSQEQQAQSRSSRFKRASAYVPAYQGKGTRKSMDEKRTEKTSKPSSLRWRKTGKNSGLDDLHRLSTMNMRASHQQQQQGGLAPPSYGDEADSIPAVPVMHLAADPRVSESSRSDASSGDIYAATTTTHTVSTHTTFFRIPKRNKNRNSLFPLPSPVKIPPPQTARDTTQSLESPATPRASTSAFSTRSYTPGGTHNPPDTVLPNASTLQRRYTETSPTKSRPPSVAVPAAGANAAALARGSLSFAEPGMNLFRQSSRRSIRSTTSSPLQPPGRLGLRDRASTTSSFGRASQDVDTPLPHGPASGRTSTSTNGRPSFGTLLHLSRFRQGSDPHSPRHGSPGALSKTNSLAMSREAVLAIPEREEGDTAGKYLERLEAAVSRSLIAGILSKTGDAFMQAVLRSYTRRFPFFGEPIDMSLRKFLLEAELPKETQQVDRVIQAFADRYHECNPGIFVAPDQAYVIAFSIMMLHTDAFNRNNKRKMQKQDYIRNTSGQGVSEDILACFYDNICWTPFVHYEEEVDMNGERVPLATARTGGGSAGGEVRKLKSALPGPDASNLITKKSSGPVDPYNLLVDQKLDTLRPPIKDSMTLEDSYNYVKPPGEKVDMAYLQRAFTHTGVLQIISARSRPTAYENQHQQGSGGDANAAPGERPEERQGIVDLKITKVGVLWRKAVKKKKTARSPWSEWGAILTGSQLYLFKNVHWAKGLVHQFTSAQRLGHARQPVVFRPPISDFKPDAMLKTDHAVALVDSTYTRHKHAFMFVRPNGQEEVFLAENEAELGDWLGLINYAAAFRAAGVRIRGMLGEVSEDSAALARRARHFQQTGDDVEQPPTTTNGGEDAAATATNLKRILSPQLHRQVMAARRQIMVQKIGELDADLAAAQQRLDALLRNGRHLLVLAPIPPKSREDVVHAAARVDASLKWLRRDIWRFKAHRDLLLMDVKLDSDLPETLLEQQPERRPAPQQQISTTSVEQTSPSKPRLMTQLPLAQEAGPSSASPGHATTPMHSAKPSQSGSVEDWMNRDVFRTPPESSTSSPGRDGVWQLPPLNLDMSSLQHQKRPSIASTARLSATSNGPVLAAPSSVLSHASSLSSMAVPPSASDVFASTSVLPTPTNGTIALAPASSLEAREVELLARATISPQATPPPSLTDGANSSVSPGGASIATTGTGQHHRTRSSTSAVRRSLQKTLRGENAHRHRRGKESDSTLRSGSAVGSSFGGSSTNNGLVLSTFDNPSTIADEGLKAVGDDSTLPGLMRDKDRFILHGKQASVVQFGGDWERMKLRREAYHRDQQQQQQRASSPSATTVTTEGREENDPDAPYLTADHSTDAAFTTADSASYTSDAATHSDEHDLRQDARIAAAAARKSFLLDETDDEHPPHDPFSTSSTHRHQFSPGIASVPNQASFEAELYRAYHHNRDGESSSDDGDEEAAGSTFSSPSSMQKGNGQPDIQQHRRSRTASSSIYPFAGAGSSKAAAAPRPVTATRHEAVPGPTHVSLGNPRSTAAGESGDDDDDEPMMTPIGDAELWRASQIAS